MSQEMDEHVAPTADREQQDEPHPVALAINTAVRRARDIDECDTEFVKTANRYKREALEGYRTELKHLRDESDAADPEMPVDGTRVQRLLGIIRRSDRVIRSDRGRTLRTSLLLGLFSAFDAFIGDLITALFGRKAELFNKLSGDISIGDILAAQDLYELKRGILADEIEYLRRKSYVEQFEALEKLFDVNLLLSIAGQRSSSSPSDATFMLIATVSSASNT